MGASLPDRHRTPLHGAARLDGGPPCFACVRWAVAKRDVGLAVQVAPPAAAAANGRNAYALLSIVPPAPDVGHAAVPRDLIVLLDTSGLMDGPPLVQGKRVGAALIESLSEHDRLKIIEFSSRPNRYARTPVRGTRREKDNAIQWVMARKASGGTEMQVCAGDAAAAAGRLRPWSTWNRSSRKRSFAYGR